MRYDYITEAGKTMTQDTGKVFRSTADLYRTALAKVGKGDDHTVETSELADGSTLYCCIDWVAGKSIVKGHFRTEWRHKAASEEYSRRVSRAKAAELLGNRSHFEVREELAFPINSLPVKLSG